MLLYELTCVLQLPLRWLRHYECALTAALNWGANVGVAQILARNTNHQLFRMAQKTDMSKAASRDAFYATVCPQFARAQAECKSKKVRIPDELRAIALGAAGICTSGRICDWTAPGLPVMPSQSGGMGGEIRRKLKRTYEGRTPEIHGGVEWKDRYPLAADAGKHVIIDGDGKERTIWMAVRILIRRLVICDLLTRVVQSFPRLMHAN